MVVGAAGQLGRDVVSVMRAAGLDVVPLTRSDADVTDPATVRAAVEAARPAVVVNCAAFVRVDEAEINPALAFAVNGLGALAVARAAAAVDARCVYLSTDYVFDGAQTEPYRETDVPRPLNVYGASKLAGEHLTRLACPGTLIVRVSGLFGGRGARGKGGNFVRSILRQARAGQPLRVVADTRISVTYTRHAAAALLSLIQEGALGTAHVANRGVTSWYEVAQEVLRASGLSAELEPLTSRALSGGAPRPMQSALESGRIEVSHTVLPRWETAIREYLAEPESGEKPAG